MVKKKRSVEKLLKDTGLNQTAGELSNQMGIGLVEVSDMTGVSMQTLDNWFKHKNKLFKVVIYGCLWVKK